MKLGPVIKLDRRKSATSNKFNNDIISEKCDVIIIFSDLWPISSNPEARFGTHGI